MRRISKVSIAAVLLSIMLGMTSPVFAGTEEPPEFPECTITIEASEDSQEIGGTVHFRIIGEIPDTGNYPDYVYDLYGGVSQSGSGLNVIKESFRATIGGVEISEVPVAVSYFPRWYFSGSDSFKGIHIEAYYYQDYAGQEVALEFDAIVAPDASIGENGCTVKGRLDYSNGMYMVKEYPVSAKIHVYGIGAVLTDSEFDSYPLKDAEYLLCREKDGTVLFFTGKTGAGEQWSEKQEEAAVYITDVNGQFGISGLKAGQEYLLRQIRQPENYLLEKDDYAFTIAEGAGENGNGILIIELRNTLDSYGANILLADDQYPDVPLEGGAFRLSKENAEHTVLYYAGAGAPGGLWSEDPDDAVIFITDEDGKTGVGGLIAGTYTFEQTEAPEDYIAENESCSFTILSGDDDFSLMFYNTLQTHELNVTLVDRTYPDVSLKGGEFRLSGETGEGVTVYYSGTDAPGGKWSEDPDDAVVFVTDDDGTFDITGLKSGEYLLEETAAPEDYAPEDARSFTISRTGDDPKIVFRNVLQTHELNVTLSDKEQSGVLLKDAEFRLSRETGEGVSEYYAGSDAPGGKWSEDPDDAVVFVTDENGRFDIDGLKTGTYGLEETKAPSGYKPLTEAYLVKITRSDSSVPVDLSNAKESVSPQTGYSCPIPILVVAIIGLVKCICTICRIKTMHP